jgi:trk system potassium uptake protein
MKSYAIIGLSSFGYYLAKEMSHRGHHILAIDIEEEKIEKVRNFVDRAVIADAGDKEILESLGLAELDGVIVSMGEKIDASILVTLYLRELKVKKIIAKANTDDHGRILDIIGATNVIFPERDEAVRLAHTLESDYFLDAITLTEGISIIEVAPPKIFVAKSLGELDLRNRYGVSVLLIKEFIPQKVVLIPTADHVIKDSDTLVLLGKDEDLENIKEIS